MNIPPPVAGQAGGSAAFVGTDIRFALKHDARTTQATLPQAVPKVEARSQSRAGSQGPTNPPQPPTSSPKGSKPSAATSTSPPQDRGFAKSTYLSQDEPAATAKAATSTTETRPLSRSIGSDQLKEVVKKLEEEERERKARAEALTADKNKFTDTTPGSTPEETIQKARILRSIALNTEQSDPDKAKIAAQAAQMEAEAKAKITERQRDAAGIQVDPVELMERPPEDSRDKKILEKIGSTYGLRGEYDSSRLVSTFA